MSPAPTYKQAIAPKQAAETFVKRTNARLEKIRSQFTSTPQAGKLQDKVCIITGVGSLKGIGRATALLYAHQGAKHLYLVDFDPTNLPGLKEKIEKTYPDVTYKQMLPMMLQSNVSANEPYKRKAAWTCSTLMTGASIFDTPSETFMNTMKINALSCFIAVKHAGAATAQANPSKGKEFGGGSIILTASVAGIRYGAGSVDYSASKAAVNSIAQTCAYQFQNTGIRVNTVCPGLSETGMTFDYARSRGSVGKIGQLNPVGRYAISEEIAQVALFLASDNSSYINGQNFAVDGGLTAFLPVVPGRIA